VVAALLTYLPKQQPAALAGLTATLGSEESRLVIVALQCLQRVSSSPFVATQIVGSSGGSGKIFSALLSGHDHVATEAARLLYRLFSPAAGRVGSSPKPLNLSGGGSSPGGSPMSTGGAMEDVAASRATKSVCFISDARCGSLIAPLKPPRQQQRGRNDQRQVEREKSQQKSTASPLLSGAIIEVVAAVACKPGSRTTELSTREALLQEVASVGRPLFALFNHPAKQVSDVAALVMQAIAEGGATAAAPMRDAALAEGAVLHHVLRALGLASAPRTQLSRHVVALWADAHEPTLRLLRRMFPVGLMRFLDVPKKKVAPMPVRRLGPPDRRAMLGSTGAPSATAAVVSNNSSGGPSIAPIASSSPTPSVVSAPTPAATTTNQQQQQQQQQQVSVLPAVPERLLSGGFRNASIPQLRANWDAFWAAVDKDHSHAALVWNERTRSELREALQAEENALRLGRQRVADAEGGVSPAWNAAEFSVIYPSLASYLTIGGIHVKLLLDAAAAAGGNSQTGSNLESLVNPREFFTAAHLHFLRRGDASLFSSSAGTSTSSGNIGTSSGVVFSRSARDAWKGLDAAAERELCVRAMAAAYAVHAAEIGPFEGMQHIVDLLDSTPSKSLRQWLLCLLEALVCPEGTQKSAVVARNEEEEEEARNKTLAGAGAATFNSDDASLPSNSHRGVQQQQHRVLEAAQANAAALVAAGGVEILVDLVSTAHEASERPSAALQTGLIASTSYTEAVKVWFYLPSTAGALPSGGAAAAAGAAMAYFEKHKTGPVSKAEIRQLYSRGVIDSKTTFWAPGMHEAAALGAIRELRWWVSSGIGHLTPFQTAEISLRVLTALVILRPAVDARGEALIPLPAAHRHMASSRCLPRLAQVALTGEPALVAAISVLILRLVEHNVDAMASLYQTGLFFFLLSYCGSNLVEVSRLFKAAHVRQRFLGAADAGPGLPLSKKSFLGSLLPGKYRLFSGNNYLPLSVIFYFYYYYIYIYIYTKCAPSFFSTFNFFLAHRIALVFSRVVWP
jgi:DnaJ family protein C protein 13